MKKQNANELTITEHLKELKKRIIIVVLTVVALFGVCLWQSNFLLTLFLSQGREIGYTMVALSPQETLIQQFRISFTVGFLISIPVLLYELAAFISPAIEKKYKKWIWLVVTIGTLLFIAGMAFAIFLLFPFMINYLKGVSEQANVLMQVSVENYISLLLTIIFCIGLAFEIPIASATLSLADLISSKSMKKHQGIVIIVIFVFAAIITPPDVVSQFMVGIPMLLLYEGSILICATIEKRRKKHLEAILKQTNTA